MKKIAIIGPSGAGKTILAVNLAKRLNLPVYHLDTYFWKPDWQEADSEQFMLKQYELVMLDQWIIDGNFRRTLSIRLFEADTIIFLDISRWRCLYQAIRRQLKYYDRNRPDFPRGCVSRFDKKFLWFLWDIWRWNANGGRRHVLEYLAIAKETNSAQIYHLRSQKKIDLFLASL